MQGRRYSLFIIGAACVLAIGGGTAVALALMAQEEAPQPDRSSAGSLEAAAAEPAVLELPPSPPVGIDIPAIAVHSSLQYLGLTVDGSLQVPAPGPRYDEAAWYKYSTTPGSVGSAIILGHVDSATDGPSVFFRLGALHPGDEILVARADGRVAVFRVDAVRSYAKVLFPSQHVFGDEEYAALRLITCGGEFDRASGQYVDNIVVFASLVDSR